MATEITCRTAQGHTWPRYPIRPGEETCGRCELVRITDAHRVVTYRYPPPPETDLGRRARNRVVEVRLTLGEIDVLISLLAYASAGGHEDVGLRPDQFERLDATSVQLHRAREGMPDGD